MRSVSLNISKKRLYLVIFSFVMVVLFLLACVAIFLQHIYYENEKTAWSNAKFILINKADLSLHVYDYKGQELMNVGCAVGLNPGDKQNKGDMRTPEGVFLLKDKQNASEWTHDFKDGNGEIRGAFGPMFLRLDVPGHKGIGIHGTHLPESIGSRTSEGCIRLSNENILRLDSLVCPPCIVVITPGVDDVSENGKKN